MPRRDTTGPNGEGSLAGRGFGGCNDGDKMEFRRGNRQGRSMRRGNGGRGRGFRNCQFRGNEEGMLLREKEVLEKRLDEISRKLEQATEDN